ncbi:zinc finger MYND domain-containing protein 12 isoform X1 [Electrophorus electricus]|uniref:MYND-type domain-containing protein n=1 Tax=Electrophorus electricus TaxID=8005 RepID=A0A4W4DVF5_ELEEL|nr:zinc finger MYND domain-containing protein 12 isoform X1 [Electrophorus electricus]
MSATINPLANPKGGKKLCELCQKPAYLQCTKCRVTYYCDVAHQQADWNSIHNKACELLILIRSPAPLHSWQTDRDHHHMQTQKRLEQLMELSHAESKRRVSEGKYEEALPAAQLSLRCAMDVYGPNAVEHVPAYLLLAEANMGLGFLSQAEGYLSKAQWTTMKTLGCSQVILHQLHRTLGRLYTATGRYRSALLHFANDIFHASEEFGLNSVVSAGGYFLMANVFVKEEKPDIAISLYSQVTSIWHMHLSKMVEHYSQRGTQGEQHFDEAQLAEVDQMLNVMLEAQQQGVNTHQSAMLSHSLGQSALLSHSLAMFWFLCRDHSKALDFGRKAAEFSRQCEEQNSLAESIQSLIQEVEKHITIQQIPTIQQ